VEYPLYIRRPIISRTEMWYLEKSQRWSSRGLKDNDLQDDVRGGKSMGGRASFLIPGEETRELKGKEFRRKGKTEKGNENAYAMSARRKRENSRKERGNRDCYPKDRSRGGQGKKERGGCRLEEKGSCDYRKWG